MKKKQIITISCLAGVFFVLLLSALLGKFALGWFNEEEEEPFVQPDLELGESYFYLGNAEVKNTVLIYPQMYTGDIFSIRISNTVDGKKNNYAFIQQDEYFLITECDENGNWDVEDVYSPPVAGEIAQFSYASLYDEITKIPQLVATIGSPAFVERIRPEGNGKLTDEFLSTYGLAKDQEPDYFEIIPYLFDEKTGYHIYNPIGKSDVYVRLSEDQKTFYYLGDDPNGEYKNGDKYTAGAETLAPAADVLNVRRVYIGDRTVDDRGFYMYLEGRDIVYATSNMNVADIVEKGIGYYIKPQLVTESEGDSDAKVAFRLTPGFMIEDGRFVATKGSPIPTGATVGIKTENLFRYESSGDVYDPEEDHYSMIDLSDPGKYAPFAATLVGKQVGDTVDVIVPVTTLAKTGEVVDYRIKQVLGIISNGKYRENTGEILTGDEKIVVAYTVDGHGTDDKYNGYIDLAAESTPDALREQLLKYKVGDECDIVYLKTYEGTGDILYSFTYEIENILSVVDYDGKSQKKVGYGTIVMFTYRLYEGDEGGRTDTMTIRIPKAGSEEGQFDNDKTWKDLYNTNGDENSDKYIHIIKSIAKGLIGQETGYKIDAENKSELAISIPFAVEIISDYELHKNATVQYAIDYTEKLSFKFKNDRDIFYGSSALYEIDSDSPNATYALDIMTTTEVIGLFENLTGDETVAVGITYQHMLDYGLHAYHLQFKMPYNCYQRDIDGRAYYYSMYDVTYDLYISEKQEDGSRYIASTQYDIVVRVEDGSMFDFLEWSFYSKWMQSTIMSVNYKHLRRMIFDLNFSGETGEDRDLYNSIWAYDITVDQNYEYSEGSVTPRLYAALVKAGLHTGPRDYAALNSLLSYTTTSYNPQTEQRYTLAGKLAQVVAETTGFYTVLENCTDLDKIYGNQLGTQNQVDMMGSENMRLFLRVLNETCYAGEMKDEELRMTAEERARLDEMLATDSYTMRFALTLLDQSKANSREEGYTFSFYNYGMNSLVVVKDEQLAKEEGENYTPSALFYIPTREVVRLARLVVQLGTGEMIDYDSY